MSVKKYSIQRVYTGVIKNVENTSIYGEISDFKSVSIENAQENVFSSGGGGNPYIASFTHSKRVTGSASMATFDDMVLELVTGTAVTTGAQTVGYTDVVEINSDASVTEKTAIGTAGSEILRLEILDSSGTVLNTLTQAVAVSATEFTYTFGTKALAFNTSDYEDGTLAKVFYNITTGAEATAVTNKSDDESATVRIEFETLVKDCNDKEFMANLIIYKAKLTGNWTMETSADGDPSTLDVSFEAMKRNCARTEFWKLVVYDEDEAS